MLLWVTGKFISILLGTFRFDVLFKLTFVFLGISPLPINALILGDPIFPIFFGLFMAFADFFFLTFKSPGDFTSDSAIFSSDFSGETFSAAAAYAMPLSDPKLILSIEFET